MKSSLYTTQKEDVSRQSAGEDIPNFSEPGTGKTITTIASIEEMGFSTGIVVCPTIATTMWKRNLERELGCKVQWLKTRSTAIDKTADFLVMSYGVLQGQHQSLLSRENEALIADEGQNLKNIEATRTQMFFGPEGDGAGGLVETSDYFFNLTGTPIERYADDLWSQLRSTHPAVLQRYSALSLQQFQQQFCRMEKKVYGDGQVTKWVSTANQNEKILNHMLYKTIGCIRRTMVEVQPDMPPVLFREIDVQASQNNAVRAALKGLTVEQIRQLLLDNDAHIATIRRLVGLSKVDGVIEYAKEVIRNEQLLVGYWHDEVGQELVRRFEDAGVDVGQISGSTSPTRRDKIRDSFMVGDIEVVVGQIQAMGTALDGLQAVGNRVLLAEDDWSASKVEQFYRRLYRNGQTLPVQVDFARCDNELDRAVASIREAKEAGAKQILG